MTNSAWLSVTWKVIEALDAERIPYVVCGSVASIIHGVVRATIDADLIADLSLQQVPRLVAALKDEFYVDEESIEKAVRQRSSFNVIHQQTMFKVDVFIPKPRKFDEAQLEHRINVAISVEPNRTIWVTSAEDNILAKLDWFRMGGEVSERQWRDILGVLRTQHGKLNNAYMTEMATELLVQDLLEQALKEALA